MQLLEDSSRKNVGEGGHDNSELYFDSIRFDIILFHQKK